MIKKILILVGIIVMLIVVGICILAYILNPDEKKITKFIKENPDRTAILIVQNDTIFASINVDKMMPLASTVKIIIAIEYADQAGNGLINPDEEIDLAELEKFYVPNTDGDAHPEWLGAVKGKVTNNKISIREIAKGMIKFSSNANTEWLINRLGQDKVNAQISKLGIKHHSKIYNIVSALFVANEAFPQAKGAEKAQKLKTLTMDQYISYCDLVHSKMVADTSYRNSLGEMDMDHQKVWSDNLPSSTVREYVGIMKKINSRTYFSEKTQFYLDEVMEYILDNPANKKWLEHSGAKGGSTAFVLTKAIYATDKKGNKTELAYFFNNLTTWESIKLMESLNEFDLKVLQKKGYSETIKQELIQP